ncbi:MAG: DegT/DnrJ/EryC1/StrS family aminotransferase [Terriglobales bacterium]
MSSPDLTATEVAAVLDVLRTPQLSLGPRNEAFEGAFAEYLGAPLAAGVSSGTAGLHVALIAAGVADGDMVITTPFSFVASANCILYERAVPIFVDVDSATGNIDPAQVAGAAGDLMRGGSAAERWLPPRLRQTESLKLGRLKAILPVHAFGQPADMDSILAVAHEHALFVIEDACEAVGAQYKSRKAGTLGDISVFAFYPNKQMTTGEGGMVVTARQDWGAVVRSLRNQGRDTHSPWLHHSRLGFNYRLDEMSAALGHAQLQRIEELLARRESVAGWYNQRLRSVPGIEVPHIASATTRMSWFVYVVRIQPPASRDEVARMLAEERIPSRPYFSPIHRQPFYVERFGYRDGHFPVAEWLGNTCLALPFSGIMSEEQVDTVCDRLRRIVLR